MQAINGNPVDDQTQSTIDNCISLATYAMQIAAALGDPQKPQPPPKLLAQIQMLVQDCGDQDNKNRDWYFIVDNDNDELDREECAYGIVHKRYWHLNHCLDSGMTSNMIDLPKGISEYMEAKYESDFSIAATRIVLTAAGFTELENPFWDGPTNEVVQLGLSRYYVTWSADTPELQELLRKKIADNRFDWGSIENFKAGASAWANGYGAVVVFFQEYGNPPAGCHAALLHRHVYENLPPEPTTEE